MEEASAAKTGSPERPSDRTIAAIDIGANSIRMVIAQVEPDGEVQILERFQRAVHLGQEVYRQGRLGSQSMRAVVAILRDYAQRLRVLNVKRVRAVATSTGREASNADTLWDRVYMATGLQVEVIDTTEESRLIVSAVCKELGGVLEGGHGGALVADVGGGSTLLTVLREGRIVASQSLRLGSIRLHEIFTTGNESPRRCAELYRQQIAKETVTPAREMSLGAIDLFVAVGGDARFAAAQAGQSDETAGVSVVGRKPFEELVASCEKKTAEDLSTRYGISFAEAETLNPALQTYQILWRKTRAEKMIVSNVSMRDGLLLELARDVTGREDAVLQQSIVQSALSLAQKYQVDVAHAEMVADLSVRLFDEMQADHGLSGRHRILLRVAAILHEVGSFVSNRAHHKHTYYLIVNSEVFGLSRDERRIVAQVARYHRRSPPKPIHVEYMALPRATRVVVNKLAALLRVADGLSRGHIERAADLRMERSGDELVVYLRGDDLFLERRAVAAKGNLFEEIYGMRVRLEQI